MEDFNWSTAIGPGIIPRRTEQDDLDFIASLKAIHPDDIFPKETRKMNDTANHPSIHCNRMEEPGNVSAFPTSPQGQELIAQRAKIIDTFQQVTDAVKPPVALGSGVEPHGCGNKETPDVVSPEMFLDRFIHQESTRAIMLIEVRLINAVPVEKDDTNVVQVTIAMELSGRIEAIVRQAYLDVGWKQVTFVKAAGFSTRVTLQFP